MKRRVLISGEQAKPTKKQHTKPCSDCPWRRDALKGWLGSFTAEEWIQAAHGEVKIDCHTKAGPQCVGSAIYRANVCKSPRDATILRASSDIKKVFATPAEFREHHDG